MCTSRINIPSSFNKLLTPFKISLGLGTCAITFLAIIKSNELYFFYFFFDKIKKKYGKDCTFFFFSATFFRFLAGSTPNRAFIFF